MTEAAALGGLGGLAGGHVDGRLSCRIVSLLENKIIINNDRKREPAGSPGTISTGVRGEARRKWTCLRNKEGGTDFYRLGLAGPDRGGGGGSGDGCSHARFVLLSLQPLAKKPTDGRVLVGGGRPDEEEQLRLFLKRFSVRWRNSRVTLHTRDAQTVPLKMPHKPERNWPPRPVTLHC